MQEWNTELAGVAQAYAEMCIFRDNPDRADQAPSFPTVGENLSASNTRTPNYTEFVERGWFSQRVNYNYDTNMCSSPGSCTDYTQVRGHPFVLKAILCIAIYQHSVVH